jgi:DNA-binding transcriptional regulator YdaS (Cro superfamily)
MENKLASYLKANGITQADFAPRVGITQGALSKLCNGGGASPETALAIERVTDGAVKVTDLKPFNIISGAA